MLSYDAVRRIASFLLSLYLLSVFIIRYRDGSSFINNAYVVLSLVLWIAYFYLHGPDDGKVE